jgi:hypothetical protein
LRFRHLRREQVSETGWRQRIGLDPVVVRQIRAREKRNTKPVAAIIGKPDFMGRRI